MAQPLRIAFLIAGVALLAFLCVHIGLGDVVAAAERANPTRLLVFFAFSAATFLTYAKRWSIVLEAMGSRPQFSLRKLLCFRAAGHAVSTLLPAAQLSGEPIRALLLRRHGLDWARSVSTVTMDRLLEASASAIVGPAYLAAFVLANGGRHVTATPWVIGGMAVGFVLLALFYMHLYRGATLISWLVRRGFLPSLQGSLESLEADLRAFVRTPSFATSLATALLAEALVLAELYTLAWAFELPISLPTLAGVTVGMGVAQLLPIPAALGSLEATEVGIVSLDRKTHV